MTINCKNKLSEAEIRGTNQEKKIAGALLDGIKFKNIQELSKIVNVSFSSVSRFVTSIEYPSFKHFIHEYNSNKNDLVEVSLSEKPKAAEIANRIVKNIKGDIYILTSRRGKSVGKFIHERLNDGDIVNYYFHETRDDIKDFLAQATSKDTIFLISLSGYSYIVRKALSFITSVSKSRRPNLIILSSEHWLHDFDEYDFITTVNINEYNLNSDKWDDYNSLCIEAINISVYMMNKYMKKLKNNKRKTTK